MVIMTVKNVEKDAKVAQEPQELPHVMEDVLTVSIKMVTINAKHAQMLMPKHVIKIQEYQLHAKTDTNLGRLQLMKLAQEHVTLHVHILQELATMLENV